MRRLTVFAMAVGCLAVTGSVAEAGSYDVHSCDTGPNRAWTLTGSPGFGARAHCPPGGDQNAGISTRIIADVPAGTEERATFTAPPGTTIGNFYWDGRTNRGNCTWKIAIEAWPSGRLLVGDRNDGGPTGSCFTKIEPAGWRGVPAGTTTITQITACGWSTCPQGGAVHSFKTIVTIEDATAPSLAVAGSGLASGQWVRGHASVVFDRWDSTGIQASRLMAGATQLAAWAHPGCDFASVAPCAAGNATGASLAPATPLGNGAHALALVVTDTAGNESAAPITAYVDSTPPARLAPEIAGGAGWRAKPEVELSWSNADEKTPDGKAWRLAPITHARYRLCPARNTCDPATAAGADKLALKLPAPGAYTLEFARQDQAGNPAPFTEPIELGYDADSPKLTIEPADADDPGRVDVRVRDDVSGVERGTIELRREGSDSWTEFRADVRDGRMAADVDARKLRAGTYDIRARAADRAGNEASTAKRSDGSDARIRLPARAAAVLTVGRARRWVRSGRRFTIAGRLRVRRGPPVAGATLELVGRARHTNAPEQPLGTVTTDAKGRFRYRGVAGISTDVRVRRAAAGTLAAVDRRVSILVRARSTIWTPRRRLRNGQILRLSGRVVGGAARAGGKAVNVQARVRGRWTTVRAARTDAGGRWRYRLRLRLSSARTRYCLRAHVPAERGFPYESGTSRRVVFIVRGAGGGRVDTCR